MLQAHRAREFLDFLKEIDRRVPEGLHRHGQLRHSQDRAGQGLAGATSALARPLHADLRFLDNQVERWFAELTRKQLQRGVHHSTRQLEADIRAFNKHNEDPKPFKWTKSADDILKRFCLRVDQNLCHELYR